jgi:hypothetical protein
MNLYHAAALALVSWYLVLPLQAPDEQGTADAASSSNASLTFAVYKTQQNCETERSNFSTIQWWGNE